MTESPRAFLGRLSRQLLLARCIALMAEIGIADRVAEAPATPTVLAAACGVNADALGRMLRFLAGNGVFRADGDGLIHNTEASDLLRDRPGSMRDLLRQSWQDVIWDTYRHLAETLRTGTPAFDRAHGMPFFAYLAAHPEIGARFDASMALMSAPENAAIAAAYPFATDSCVVDVGGGRGGLLAAILARHPTARGILTDQPQVLEDAARLQVKTFGARCRLASGDFFRAVPEGGDVYILKRILHDWPDEDAVRILRAVGAALTPAARVLVVDAVIAPGNDPDPNKLLDVGIMALLRGRERTAEDFVRLFAASGLKLLRILPPAPPSTLSIVEGAL
jgi:hypothetical protein